MTPINCVSKSRSFSSDLLTVAMNSHGWLFCQDKGKEESSATSLTQPDIKTHHICRSFVQKGFNFILTRSPHRSVREADPDQMLESSKRVAV